MGWWEKLKAWQKGGVVVGGAHLIIYMTLLYQASKIHGESGIGYLLLFMEWPFWISLNIFPLGTIAVIGTFFYALIGMVLGWLLSQIIRVTFIFSGQMKSNQEKKYLWAKLKLWQTMGIALGIIHLVVFIVILLLFGDKSVTIIRKIELGLPFSDDFYMVIIGIVGTCVYGLIGMGIGWFFVLKPRQISYKKREKIQ